MTNRPSVTLRAATGLVLGVLVATGAGYAGRQGRGASTASRVETAKAASGPAAPAASCCGAKADPAARQEAAACPMPSGGDKSHATCPMAPNAAPDKMPSACPMHPAVSPKADPAKAETAASAKPAKKVSSVTPVEAGGFRPSAFANVSVRFRPRPSRASGLSAASIYVRPGADRASIARRRGTTTTVGVVVPSAPTVAHGRAYLRGNPAMASFATARVSPAGRLEVACGTNDGHAHAPAAGKGGTQ